jgi:hypothetical protein
VNRKTLASKRLHRIDERGLTGFSDQPRTVSIATGRSGSTGPIHLMAST